MGYLPPETELLLFTAARRDHMERLIWPALARGEVVLCDRYIDSTRVLQTFERQQMRAMIDMLHEQMIGLDPDHTFLLRVTAEEARRRKAAVAGPEDDRFEEIPRMLEHEVAAYAALVPDSEGRIVEVDAMRSVDEVYETVLKHLMVQLKAKDLVSS